MGDSWAIRGSVVGKSWETQRERNRATLRFFRTVERASERASFDKKTGENFRTDEKKSVKIWNSPFFVGSRDSSELGV